MKAKSSEREVRYLPTATTCIDKAALLRPALPPHLTPLSTHRVEDKHLGEQVHSAMAGIGSQLVELR